MQTKRTRHDILKFFIFCQYAFWRGKIFIYTSRIGMYCAKQLNSSKKLCKFEKRISIVNLVIRQRNIFRTFLYCLKVFEFRSNIKIFY